MRFTLHCSDGRNERRFSYDNESSVLAHEDGRRVAQSARQWGEGRQGGQAVQAIPRTSAETPNGKAAKVRVLKVQLGLSCNYSCEYCSQRFVPHGDNGTPSDVEKFVRNLDLWLDG